MNVADWPQNQRATARRFFDRTLLSLSLAAIALLLSAMPAAAQDHPDEYRFRVDGAWWYVNPTGTINVNGGNVDVQKDLRFNSYSSFSGSVDWRFTRRQHLLVSTAPASYSGGGTTSREIVYQGQTITTGATVDSSLTSLSVSPGYEFDFVSRDRGHFGFDVLANLLNISSDLHATGTIIKPDGTTTGSYSGSGSVFAPLPVIGFTGRGYIVNRLYFDGTANGMYFFGYGNFISARAVLGLEFGGHYSVRAGYQLGGRTDIHGSDTRIGVNLIQKGVVVGIEGKW